MPEQAPSIADQAERDAVLAALRKRERGERLTAREIAGVARFERRQADEQIEKALSAVPQKTLADLLQTSRKVLLGWERDGMPGRKQEGRRVLYDLWAVLLWLKDRWLAEARETATDSPALERYRLARAQREELELEKLKGRLLDVDEVEAGQVARLVALKRALMAIPRASAPTLAGMTEPREIEGYLAERVRELLGLYAGARDGRRRRKTKLAAKAKRK